MAQISTATPMADTAVKKEGRSFNLKTKAGDKWKTLGTLFLRNDGSGGVATLFKPDGSKTENVAIYPNDGKYGAKKS